MNLSFDGEVIFGCDKAVAIESFKLLVDADYSHSKLQLMKWVNKKCFEVWPVSELFGAKLYLKSNPLYLFTGSNNVGITPVGIKTHQFSECCRATSSLSSEASVDARVEAAVPIQRPWVGLASLKRLRACSIWRRICSMLNTLREISVGLGAKYKTVESLGLLFIPIYGRIGM